LLKRLYELLLIEYKEVAGTNTKLERYFGLKS